MERIRGLNVIKMFKCKHREFMMVSGDKEIEGDIPVGLFQVHSCDEISVYQKKRGLFRYYKLKKKNE
jgi:hypothetical protein